MEHNVQKDYMPMLSKNGKYKTGIYFTFRIINLCIRIIILILLGFMFGALYKPGDYNEIIDNAKISVENFKTISENIEYDISEFKEIMRNQSNMLYSIEIKVNNTASKVDELMNAYNYSNMIENIDLILSSSENMFSIVNMTEFIIKLNQVVIDLDYYLSRLN